MNLTLRTLPAALCLIALAAPIARAQAPGPPGPGRFGSRTQVMQALDIDGDGELSEKEIENAASALKTLDKDKNGKLSVEELRAAPMGRAAVPPVPTVQELVTKLLAFDKNGDGKLAKDELPSAMQIVIERVDLNKDGFADKAELTVFAEGVSRRAPASGGPGDPRRKQQSERRRSAPDV